MEGTNLEELVLNLKHQFSLYRQLVDLLREEREHLVGAKLKEIRDCTFGKEAILDEIQREEFRRQRWIKEAAKYLAISESEVCLELIAQKLAPQTQYESLISLKTALNHIVKKAREMNYENHKLAAIALKDAQAIKRNLLGISAETPSLYGPKGNMGGNVRDQSARIFNKEA